MEKPTIEFKNGKKIVTFKDGAVKEHTVEGHERARQMFIAHRDNINANIAAIDDDLTKRKATAPDAK